jgi:outer membrane protein insertion porin family
LFEAPDGSPISYELGDYDLKYSMGLSVQWLSPMGLFKFSYAVPVNAEDFSDKTFGDRTERFQFTIGGAF